TYDPRRLADEKHHSPFQHLQDCLDKLAPCTLSLVFIDPFAPLYMHGSQNTSRDVAITLHWLRQMQKRYDCTLIADTNVVKRHTKDDFLRVQDRISGSGSFLAYADTQFTLSQEKPPDPLRTLYWFPRSSAP